VSIVEDVKVLRKRLGIKKLRKVIPISEFEKAVIIGLREKERHRIAQKTKQYA
jgi:hypothetical protein